MADKKTHEQLCEERKYSGKKKNQKVKAYVVLQYLLRETDAEHIKTADKIVAYLDERGISAERRSIYRDIDEINRVALMMEEGCTIDEATEMIADDEDDELKIVIYDKSKKGFYARPRHYEIRDIRLLAECVYSAKFLSLGQAERLANVVCEHVSEHQQKKIKHDAFLTDRVKTDNQNVLNNITIINDAMSRMLDGERHEPEKISFQYLKYSVQDMRKQVARRKGSEYIVSPYKLLINDGNYYLLAFDDVSKKMRTYRVDRMKGVNFTGEPREGAEAFAAVNLKNYTKRVFSMYGGKREYVTLRFINPLLDAVVDRFGTKDVHYAKADEKHFRVSAEVEISDQFYGWLAGFRKGVQIEAPQRVVDDYKKFINDIAGRYE